MGRWFPIRLSHWDFVLSFSSPDLENKTLGFGQIQSKNSFTTSFFSGFLRHWPGNSYYLVSCLMIYRRFLKNMLFELYLVGRFIQLCGPPYYQNWKWKPIMYSLNLATSLRKSYFCYYSFFFQVKKQMRSIKETCKQSYSWWTLEPDFKSILLKAFPLNYPIICLI